MFNFKACNMQIEQEMKVGESFGLATTTMRLNWADDTQKSFEKSLNQTLELLLWQGLTQSSFLGHFQGASLRLLNDGTFFPRQDHILKQINVTKAIFPEDIHPSKLYSFTVPTQESPEVSCIKWTRVGNRLFFEE